MHKNIDELNHSFDNCALESDDGESFDEEIDLDEYVSSDEDEDDLEHLIQNPYWSYNIVQPTRLMFNGNSGLNFDELDSCSKPIDYFNLFLTEEMVHLIVDQSNLYGHEKYPNMEYITPEEIDTIVGIFINMGFAPLPKLEDYWSTDPVFIRSANFGDIMPRRRFMQIMRSLHFEDNHNNSGSKLYKIERFLKMFVDRCQHLKIPGEGICIDESLILFRGRLLFRQYIPNKRHRYGIKLFKLCSAGGYTHNIQIYAGKNEV